MLKQQHLHSTGLNQEPLFLIHTTSKDAVEALSEDHDDKCGGSTNRYILVLSNNRIGQWTHRHLWTRKEKAIHTSVMAK